jgi:hypothetical protein
MCYIVSDLENAISYEVGEGLGRYCEIYQEILVSRNTGDPDESSPRSVHIYPAEARTKTSSSVIKPANDTRENVKYFID